MPTDNEPIALGTGNLYIIGIDMGEETPLGSIHTTAIDIADPPIDPSIVHRINKNLEASFTIRMPDRKMSRKRFVKQLMASGVPRNVDNSMAEITRTHGHSYAWAWLVISFGGFLPWES